MGIQEEECGECRTSDRLEQSVVKRKCVFKFGCRHGRGCNKWHSNEQNEHFDRRSADASTMPLPSSPSHGESALL